MSVQSREGGGGCGEGWEFGGGVGHGWRGLPQVGGVKPKLAEDLLRLHTV